MISGVLDAGLATNTSKTMAKQLNAIVEAATRVTAIDTTRRTLALDDGREFEYSALVLATGASQNTLRLSDADAGNVVTVNDLESYGHFRDRLLDKRSVLICGGGLIGCEFANDLASGGFEVQVLEGGPYPLSRMVPVQLGQLIEKRLGQCGVKWQFDTLISSVVSGPAGYTIRTHDGARPDAQHTNRARRPIGGQQWHCRRPPVANQR